MSNRIVTSLVAIGTLCYFKMTIGPDDRANRDQFGGDAGKPVIRGTRITVELILSKLAEGETESELLEDYPHLTRADVRASIAYGAASVAHEEGATAADPPKPDKP
jgi:uncharacterized protein (DUF433 family)